MSNLRSQIIRLAHDNPGEVQDALLTVLAADKGKVPPAFLKHIKKKKDDKSEGKSDKDDKGKEKDDKLPAFLKDKKKASLRDQVIRVAFENPGPVQKALLVVLAEDEGDL